MILYNPQDKKILYQVAKLHKENINKGFLSSLGEEFLYCVYRSISEAECSVLIVYIRNNKVIGFVAGTTNLKEVKEKLRSGCKLTLFKVLLKLVLNPRNFMKFLETKRYSDMKDNIKAELLGIAVDEKYRGQGIAQDLYKELCKYFKNRGFGKFKIVVGEGLVRAQKFYEKMGAYRQKKIELHKGQVSHVYIQEIEKCRI